MKHNYATEPYVKIIIQKKYRSAYAKFRCRVAPIKLETVRYGQNRIPIDQRLCESCGVVEDEYHVLIECNMYKDIRHNLFNEITTVELDFREQSIDTQFLQILSNSRYSRSVSKAIHLMLNKRHDVMLR